MVSPEEALIKCIDELYKRRNELSKGFRNVLSAYSNDNTENEYKEVDRKLKDKLNSLTTSEMEVLKEHGYSFDVDIKNMQIKDIRSRERE